MHVQCGPAIGVLMSHAKSLALIIVLATGLVLLQSSPAFAHAQYDGYEAIVRNLMGESTTAKAPTEPEDPFANVHFHIAVGAVASYLNLAPTPNLSSGANLHGVEVDLGIDLFSPYWQAVGTLTSFVTDYERQTQLAMKEFGLLVQHKIPLEGTLSLILGAGLTARYLTLSGYVPRGVNSDNTTPASQFDGGVDFGITPGLGVILSASYEAALVRTADAGSINGTVMLEGTF